MRDMFLKKRTICESTDVEASAVSDLKRSVEKNTHTQAPERSKDEESSCSNCPPLVQGYVVRWHSGDGL